MLIPQRFSLGALVVLFLLLVAGVSYAQGPQITGAWRQNAVEWIYAPPEIVPRVRAAQAAILYFGPGHDFVLLYGTVIQMSPYQSEALSVGDGRSVYVGTWSQDGNTLNLKYRVVDRTIPMSDVYPGPELRARVIVGRDAVIFDNKRFHRVNDLDGDLEAEATRARDGYYPLGKRQN